MNLGALSAFGSAVYPGMQVGANNRATILRNQENAKQEQFQTQALADDRAALAIWGRAFNMAPPNAPVPMAPGVASQAAAPPPQSAAPMAPPQGALPPAPVTAPPAGPPPLAMTSTGQPAMPPGTYLNPNAPPPVASPERPPQASPTQQLAPPPAGGPSGAPPAAAASAGAPPGAGGPSPVVPPAAARSSVAPQPPAAAAPGRIHGLMEPEEMAQRLLAANPGLEKRPDLLMRAMVKGQQFLTPYGRAEVAALQLQQKIEMANQKFELGQANAATRLEVARMAADTRREIEEVRRTSRNENLIATLEAQQRRLEMQIKSREGINAAVLAVKRELGDAKNINDATKIENTRWYQERKTQLLEQGLAEQSVKTQLDHEIKLIQEQGRNTRASGRTRAVNETLATKAGLKVDPKWTDEELQAQTADAMAKKNSEAVFSDQTAEFIARESLKDPSLLKGLGYGPTGNINRRMVWGYVQQLLADKPPGELAAARVALLGAGQEARTTGTQAARVSLGAKEMEKLGPQVLATARTLDKSQFPTWNALNNAVEKGTGSVDVVNLANWIQTIKSAYTQVMMRGGATSVDAQRRADKILNESMTLEQITGVIDTMRKEAEVVEEAAASTRDAIRTRITGGAPAAAAPTAPGGTTSAAPAAPTGKDPLKLFGK